MFGCVRRYVSHDMLCYITTHVLTFVSPHYFLLRYINFYFVMLTQYVCYILYASSWFDFDIRVLVMIMVCVLFFWHFVALFLCIMFHVFTLHFHCLMSHLLHVSSCILAFCHNSYVTISLCYHTSRVNFREVRISAPR